MYDEHDEEQYDKYSDVIWQDGFEVGYENGLDHGAEEEHPGEVESDDDPYGDGWQVGYEEGHQDAAEGVGNQADFRVDQSDAYEVGKLAGYQVGYSEGYRQLGQGEDIDDEDDDDDESGFRGKIRHIRRKSFDFLGEFMDEVDEDISRPRRRRRRF